MGLRNTTLVFLAKRQGENVSQVCLAMKKRGFGTGRWNGVGGKVEGEETIEEAARREAQEEISVHAKDLNKVAELSFYFPHNPAWDQLVHVYFSEQWEGDPAESEEMAPQWFAASELPFHSMWSDDPLWLPHVLAGKLVKAIFTFGENDVVKGNDVQVVKNFA